MVDLKERIITIEDIQGSFTKIEPVVSSTLLTDIKGTSCSNLFSCVKANLRAVQVEPNKVEIGDLLLPDKQIKTTYACSSRRTSRRKVRMSNLQSYPMCRCPSPRWPRRQTCRGQPNGLCSSSSGQIAFPPLSLVSPRAGDKRALWDFGD